MKKVVTILIFSLLISIGTAYAGLIDLGTVSNGDTQYALHYDDTEGVVYAEFAAPERFWIFQMIQAYSLSSWTITLNEEWESDQDLDSFVWQLASLDNYISLYADSGSFIYDLDTYDENGDLVSYWTSTIDKYYLVHFVNMENQEDSALWWNRHSGIFKFEGDFIHTPIPGTFWLLSGGFVILLRRRQKQSKKRLKNIKY